MVLCCWFHQVKSKEVEAGCQTAFSGYYAVQQLKECCVPDCLGFLGGSLQCTVHLFKNFVVNTGAPASV